MTININISIEKKHLVFFSCLIALFGIVLITNAYNPNALGGNPQIMGHSADELDVEFGDSIQKLQQIFNNLDSNGDGIIDNTEFATNAEYSNTAGNAESIEWNNINNKPYVIENSENLATTPPKCTGENNALQWTGSTWDCVSVSGGSTGVGCSWDGWAPQTSGKTCIIGGCAETNYYTQQYCSDEGYVTNTRTASYCSRCHDVYTCLVSGTKILMADNSLKDIEDIKIGEYVINEKGDKDMVADLWQPIMGERNTYIINDNIEVTPDHPFMTTKGLKVIDVDMLKRTQENSDLYQGIEATELKVGDILITKNGKQIVETIEENSERPFEEQVYTLILEDGDGFYANNYLVADGR